MRRWFDPAPISIGHAPYQCHAGGGQFGRYGAVRRQPEAERYRDSILGMDAIGWLILVVIVLVVVAVAFVIIRRKRRGGGVIATKDKG